MREAAARHARRFGSEQIVPAYEDLYQRLLYRRFGTGVAVTVQGGESSAGRVGLY